MASSNNSPFVEGNKWRFTEGKQPQRNMTMLQLKKRLEALLYASADKLNEIVNDETLPLCIRVSAKHITEGEPNRVVELINSLDNGRKRTKA